MSSAFFDIFSKKISPKKRKLKTEKILIDYREKNCLIPSELKEKGFEIEFKELKVADYIIKGIAIERKTISDFISSMINKRLIRQLQELQQYNKKILLIEGLEEQELYSDNINNGVNSNSIRGFILSIILKYQIPIIFTKNYKDTSKYIELLSRKKENSQPLNITKKTLNKKEQMQFILESFPGIGPKNAKKLLEKFSNLQGIFNASQEELKNIIGKKAEIFNLLQENY